MAGPEELTEELKKAVKESVEEYGAKIKEAAEEAVKKTEEAAKKKELWGERIKRFWDRLVTKTSIIIGLLIIWLAYQVQKWKVGITDFLDKVAKVVPEEISGRWWIVLIGTIVFFWLVYLANKWKDEPKIIKMEPEEREARQKQLIAFLIMLVLGFALIAGVAHLYAVNYYGINLLKNLLFLLALILVGNLILQPGTGNFLIKFLIIGSLIFGARFAYDFYKGRQPLPPEKRIELLAKSQACQEALRPHLERMEEITQELKLSSEIEKEIDQIEKKLEEDEELSGEAKKKLSQRLKKLREKLEEAKKSPEEIEKLIKKLEVEKKKCQEIRKFYEIREKKKPPEAPLVKLLEERKYKVLLEKLDGKMWEAEITHRFVTSNRLILQVFQRQKLIFSGTLEEQKDGCLWQGGWRKVAVGLHNWGLLDWGNFKVKFDKGCVYAEGSWTHRGKKKKRYLQFFKVE